jgi:O-acetyl-ADP-ribose deacetylase (regulator of RNase III)
LAVLNANIVHVAADAIVHPTSGSIAFGGQVGAAILRAGGNQMQQIVNQLNSRIGHLGTFGGKINFDKLF